MQLISPLEAHIIDMMSWFSNEVELKQWSGPNFRYPFNLSTFTEDLKISPTNSFSLVSEEDELLGFGQYYQRLGKCHLGRLVVNPKCRGKGLITDLIKGISLQGTKALSVTACSLFVLAHNKSAIKAYQKAGFILADYPDEIPTENCLYMVKYDI